MLKNNNRKVIWHMVFRSLINNRRKNLILMIAVALSAFMVTAILTLGGSYFQARQETDIRMSGVKKDAVLLGPTEDQIRFCKEDERITQAGVSADCGKIVSIGQDDTLHTVLLWGDKSFWEYQKSPALEWAEGTYPVKEEELMMSKSALAECAGEEAGIGSRITLTYEDPLGVHTRTFKVSGIYQNYTGEAEAYVSEDFYRDCGAQISDPVTGTVYLEFADPVWSDSQMEKFGEELGVGKRQVYFVTNSVDQQYEVYAGMAGIAALILLGSYLLIYNILSLSVASDVRRYGLLQTIGMTERQIRFLVFCQMFLPGAAGTAAGLLLGGFCSGLFVPGLLRGLEIEREAAAVHFYPAVYILAAFLCLFTVYEASRRPAKTASLIPPIEAAVYTDAGRRKEKAHTGKLPLELNMACRSLKKEKKKTIVTILSMGISVSLFLCVMTLISSQESRTRRPIYMGADLIIQNDTFLSYDRSQYRQIFGQDFCDAVENTAGVRSVHAYYASDIIVPWEEGFADTWMNSFYDSVMSVPYEEDKAEYKQNPKRFYSIIGGIDEELFEKINADLEQPIGKEDFMSGKCCILYRNFAQLPDSRIIEQSFKFYPEIYFEKGEKDKVQSIEVAGVTDEVGLIPHTGLGPNILVSSSYLQEMEAQPKIMRLCIYYDESYDGEAENQILSLLAESDAAQDSSTVSKIQVRENLRKAQGNMMIFGLVIAAALGLVGLMNYINTSAGSIQSRLKELSVLESIGMTDRQIHRMLFWEGNLYAGAVTLFTAVVGGGTTYLIFQALNEYQAEFVIPLLPVLLCILAVWCICTLIPAAACHILSGKESIIERIRE